MSLDTPFHEGELAVQRRLNELAEARNNGRAISDAIVPGAVRFVAAQPFAIVGTRRADGALRATVMYGAPGFARVTGERALRFELDQIAPDPLAPWLADLEHDARIAVLFLEPNTRRRLRINGRALRSGQAVRVDVIESFPNCPKYIQRRELVELTALSSETVDPSRLAERTGVELGSSERALIASADTFFIASANPRGELDASHRGGPPGFVEIVDARTLRIPDYSGNHMYNTLGNLTLDPHAGVTFVDFDSGRVLALSGRAEILFDEQDPGARTGGTRRFWSFAVDEWSAWDPPTRARWRFVEASPLHP